MKNNGDISEHILPTAATMVGVCMTVISIVKVIELSHGPSRMDEYFAVTSVFFLLSAGASYMAIRSKVGQARKRMFEKLADRAFMLGMVVMTVFGILFAFEVV